MSNSGYEEDQSRERKKTSSKDLWLWLLTKEINLSSIHRKPQDFLWWKHYHLQAKRTRGGTKWTSLVWTPTFSEASIQGPLSFAHHLSVILYASLCFPVPKPVSCVLGFVTARPVSGTTVCSSSLLLRNKPLQYFTAYNSSVGGAGWQRLVSLPAASAVVAWPGPRIHCCKGWQVSLAVGFSTWEPPQALPAHGWLSFPRGNVPEEEVETASKIYIQWWNVYIYLYIIWVLINVSTHVATAPVKLRIISTTPWGYLMPP